MFKVTPEGVAAARAKNRAFAAADDAWGAELVRLFGRDAGNARYEKRGRGDEGSALRQLHDARDVAMREWEVLPDALKGPAARMELAALGIR